jgi:hypothetical protein
MQESQAVETNQRHLLGQLIDGRVADGEDRDAVDTVVAQRIRKQDERVEVTAAHQHDVAVLEDVTIPQPRQLHSGIMAIPLKGAAPRGSAITTQERAYSACAAHSR